MPVCIKLAKIILLLRTLLRHLKPDKSHEKTKQINTHSKMQGFEKQKLIDSLEKEMKNNSFHTMC